LRIGSSESGPVFVRGPGGLVGGSIPSTRPGFANTRSFSVWPMPLVCDPVAVRFNRAPEEFAHLALVLHPLGHKTGCVETSVIRLVAAAPPI